MMGCPFIPSYCPPTNCAPPVPPSCPPGSCNPEIPTTPATTTTPAPATTTTTPATTTTQSPCPKGGCSTKPPVEVCPPTDCTCNGGCAPNPNPCPPSGCLPYPNPNPNPCPPGGCVEYGPWRVTYVGPWVQGPTFCKTWYCWVRWFVGRPRISGPYVTNLGSSNGYGQGQVGVSTGGFGQNYYGNGFGNGNVGSVLRRGNGCSGGSVCG